MSDPTRPAGGASAERARHTAETPGRQAPDNGPSLAPDTPPGAPADHTAGARAEAAPRPRADGDRPATGTSATGAYATGTPVTGTSATGTSATGATGTSATGATGTEVTGTSATETPATGTSATGGTGPGTSLLPHEECDELEQRLHHAVAGFVDAPRAAVEEADRVLEEVAARFTDAVTRRRSTLRASWRSPGADRQDSAADTEQLRLALRDYRELSEHLMRR